MSSDAFIDADWPAPANVRAVTTLRSGPGVSLQPFDLFNLGLRSGDEVAAVQDNRERLVTSFGLPSPPGWLHQVHGTDVLRISRESLMQSTPPAIDAEPQADAALTDSRCCVLAILSADCLPVLLCNEDGTEVAAAHAGWRGLSAGVLENTVAAMASPGKDLVAWLGPAAGPTHYEVGAEVRDAFLAQDDDAESAFVATRAGHWLVDLYALARQRLAAAGVRNVHGGDWCTISDPQRFYSHRRDGRTGRMATLIWMV